MARVHGVGKNTIHRIWQDHGLKPHLAKSFKLARDPKFLEKLTDVMGVYLTPPQNAVVLCVDEKSQIQALDRTQPRLPLKPGRCCTSSTTTSATAPRRCLRSDTWGGAATFSVELLKLFSSEAENHHFWAMKGFNVVFRLS
ncbi:MAG: hypothetical protein ABIZ81_02930 [Opitutaceae bacterium]